MKLLHFLCLGLAIAAARADQTEAEPAEDHASAAPDRCLGLEMDAAAVNEEGIPYFFKDGFLFKGFHGLAEKAKETFTELDQHRHLGHVDAAFRLHHDDHPSEHNNLVFFLDNKVFSYYQHKLEDGYPKDVSEVFPGIPDHLDAAVECPKPECDEDSVIFFKGDHIFHFNVRTKAVDVKEFRSMPNCTSAFRFLEHYYCLHGHMFSKFDPKTGEVHGKYPKEARDYFMRCSKFSEDSDHLERERCSRVHLDAVTTDSEGNLYAFRGHHFLHKDVNGTLTAEPIESAFPEVHSEVDAAFSVQDRLYLVKDDHVFAYKAGENHTLLDGYPRPVREELGVDGHVDAAFSCDRQLVHIVRGSKVYDVDLSASPRAATNERPVPIFRTLSAAMCGPPGVTVVAGHHFYRSPSLLLLLAGRTLPEQRRVALDMLGCDH